MPRVHEAHKAATVNAHADHVAVLLDADCVPLAGRKDRTRSCDKEALATRVARIFFAELPAVRLEKDVVEALVVDVVPEDPADLPRVRPTAPDLAIRAEPNHGCEVAPSSRGKHQRGMRARRGLRAGWLKGQPYRVTTPACGNMAVAVVADAPRVPELETWRPCGTAAGERERNGHYGYPKSHLDSQGSRRAAAPEAAREVCRSSASRACSGGSGRAPSNQPPSIAANKRQTRDRAGSPAMVSGHAPAWHTPRP